MIPEEGLTLLHIGNFLKLQFSNLYTFTSVSHAMPEFIFLLKYPTMLLFSRQAFLEMKLINLNSSNNNN